MGGLSRRGFVGMIAAAGAAVLAGTEAVQGATWFFKPKLREIRQSVNVLDASIHAIATPDVYIRDMRIRVPGLDWVPGQRVYVIMPLFKVDKVCTIQITLCDFDSKTTRLFFNAADRSDFVKQALFEQYKGTFVA